MLFRSPQLLPCGPTEIYTLSLHDALPIYGWMLVKKVGRLAWQTGRYVSWHQPANWTSEQKVLGVVLSKSRAFYTVAIARNRVGVVGMLEVHGGLSNIHRGDVKNVLRASNGGAGGAQVVGRSEEHTSELQSHHDLVCRLLLEKKK